MQPIYHTEQLPLFVFSKVCPTCIPPAEKPIECFAKDKKFNDGHKKYCKECINVRNRTKYDPEKEQQRRLKKDPEKTRASFRKHYTNHQTEYNDRLRKKYAGDETIREKKRIQGQKWRQNNPDKVKNGYINHYKNNKRAYQEKDMRRKALMQRGVHAEKVSYDLILEQCGMTCHICNKPIQIQTTQKREKLNFEHVIPLIRGGAHTEENIKPSHMVCNQRKHDKLMSELTEWERRGPWA